MDGLTDTELDQLLADLGDHLEMPDLDLVSTVSARLATPTPIRRRPRPTALARAAAIAVGLALASLAVPDVRHAAADWLGIGATEVERRDDVPAATSTTTPTTGSESAPAQPETVIAAARELGIDLVLPDEPIVAWSITDDAASRGVDVRFPSFTLSAQPIVDDSIVFRKIVDIDAPVESIVFDDGAPARWIPDEHVLEVGGAIELVGSALLWVDGDVQYRIGELPDRNAAVAIAESIR